MMKNKEINLKDRVLLAFLLGGLVMVKVFETILLFSFLL